MELFRSLQYLSVGSADLDNVCELLGFVVQSLVKCCEARQKSVVDLYGRGNVHGCRVCVIGALQVATFWIRKMLSFIHHYMFQ